MVAHVENTRVVHRWQHVNPLIRNDATRPKALVRTIIQRLLAQLVGLLHEQIHDLVDPWAVPDRVYGIVALSPTSFATDWLAHALLMAPRNKPSRASCDRDECAVSALPPAWL